MQARNRNLNEWYGKIERGEIKLPRFQRFEAWDWRRISSLVNTITHNLPLGITLVLEVKGKEKFVSRFLSTAPVKNDQVLEQLLDGQQRLTSLWRVLQNNYEFQTYYVYVPEFDKSEKKESKEQFIFCRGRYLKKNGQKYPLWCDNPEESLKRGLIPTNLLKPVDIQAEIDSWIFAATNSAKPDKSEEFENFFNWKKTVSDKIKDLRAVVANYNLPFLALPGETPKSVALEVFINMNTNSKPLSTYDIIVAEVESEMGESLHDKQNSLVEKFPSIERYGSASQLILNTSALLQDELPNQKGAWEMDKKVMVKNWEIMSKGLNKMANFLENEGILDETRLPTNAVLWVIAALYNFIPDSGDKKGWSEKILKQYLWRAFFTSRYENSAATHAFYDYLHLKKVLGEETKKDGTVYSTEDVPIFDESEYEIPDETELINAAWPKNATIRGRAVMAITLKLGANDFATEEKVTNKNIADRHYHHIFPDALLKEASLENSFIAMNCALITDKTNLNIGRKEPLTYLKDRFQWADEESIKFRLNSHLIPIKELATGGYEGLENEERLKKLKKDYECFIEKRAKLFAKAAKKLCSGERIIASEIISKTD